MLSCTVQRSRVYEFVTQSRYPYLVKLMHYFRSQIKKLFMRLMYAFFLLILTNDGNSRINSLQEAVTFKLIINEYPQWAILYQKRFYNGAC
jgi:hypothetical protein